MRKIYVKLASSLVAVLMAFTMVAGVSYAWLTLSNSPTVNGIQVAIGGGNTILLAADLTQTVTNEYGNEVVVHYPGPFSETLNLSQYDTYDYLAELAGLTPVSTADGIHWILPAYDENTGALLDLDEFTVDGTLSYANATEKGAGTYAYVDFWVVSPGAEYKLHVATDTKENEGSFLMELPKAVETEDGFTLGTVDGHVASTARVGFLVNEQVGGTAAMDAYSKSSGYDSRFKSLHGVYQEQGYYEVPGKFTIYEPNATTHPLMDTLEGGYMVTRPLAYDEMTQTIAETDISDRLTVQESSAWRTMNGELWIEEIFQASLAGRNTAREDEATAAFYQNYLNGQVTPYVASGKFVTNTGILYDFAYLHDNGGVVEEAMLGESVYLSGATEDVFITELQRNVPQRIRMFIWLEGQDPDCSNTDAIAASAFALGLELSGETK